jgi:hypothetical protein
MQIRLFRNRTGAVNFFDAKRLAESEGLRLLSNAEADSNRTEIEKLINPESFVLLCTGTLVAHPKRMGTFSDVVSYFDPLSRKKNVLEIPPEYRGVHGIALVSNDYAIHDSAERITYEPRSLSVVHNFPRESGEYDLESLHGLPITVSTMNGKGYISRFRQEMVGPVIRCVSRYVDDKRKDYSLSPDPKPGSSLLSDDVFLNTCPSGAFVVIAAN